MRTQEWRKAARTGVTAALTFLTGILALLAMPGIAPAGTTERVSVDGAGNQGDSLSSEAAISADGRFVAFTSLSTNLCLGTPTACPTCSSTTGRPAPPSA